MKFNEMFLFAKKNKLRGQQRRGSEKLELVPVKVEHPKRKGVKHTEMHAAWKVAHTDIN